MGKKSRILFYVAVLLLVFITAAAPALADSAPVSGGTSGTIYVIPIKDDIDNGNWLFVERAYQEALTNNAAAIIFEIDTYGGYVDTAINMKDLILHAPVPTYTFVNTKAISAGALLALAGEQLIMAPGATIGAAEPRLMGERADEKTLSMWREQLSGTAEARGRDGQIAAAMADSDIVVEGLSEAGKLVTLTANQAIEHKMADQIFSTRAELMVHYGLNGPVVEQEKSFQENMGGWLSNPYVSAVLLILGIAGIVIELLTVGSFGIFGAVGLLSFALYFIGHFWVGNIGVGAVILFLAGIVLLILEIFVIPGFGVTGILGILAMLASIVMAAESFAQGALILAVALAVAILIIVFTLKNKKTRKVWSKIILFHKQENKEGYVAPDDSLAVYVGKRGKALTILRPAGTAEIEGRRLDVVTDGEFIEAGTTIEVSKVEGTRVVVREAQATPPQPLEPSLPADEPPQQDS